MHKNLCATFCGKPVESVESVEKANKGRPASETKKSRHALRTAHRAYRITLNKKFQKNLLTKSKVYGIMQIVKEI
jgi:hypothetical protein